MKRIAVAIAAFFSATCLADTAGADLSRAQQLAQEAIIVDTHIDAPSLFLDKPWVDLSQTVADREFDYPRARAGGLDVAFMSIYTSATQDEDNSAWDSANRQIDVVEALVQRHPEKFALLRSPRDVEKLRAGGHVLLPLGMENGAPLGEDIAQIKFFFDRGVRYITLAHSANNAMADSSYAREGKWNGLSPLGQQAVAEMNRLGIMVDVSHLSDASAKAAIELSRVPVVATHSAFRHFTPGFQRNIADEEAIALSKRGGVVQIPFGAPFVDPVAAMNMQEYFRASAEHEKHIAALKAAGEPVPTESFSETWEKAHPRRPTAIETVLDQIDYGVQLIGIDHVGIGSDFDGVDGDLPEGLKSVADFPNFIAGLQARGYSDADIKKVLGGNLLRVWRAVEDGAGK